MNLPQNNITEPSASHGDQRDPQIENNISSTEEDNISDLEHTGSPDFSNPITTPEPLSQSQSIGEEASPLASSQVDTSLIPEDSNNPLIASLKENLQTTLTNLLKTPPNKEETQTPSKETSSHLENDPLYVQLQTERQQSLQDLAVLRETQQEHQSMLSELRAQKEQLEHLEEKNFFETFFKHHEETRPFVKNIFYELLTKIQNEYDEQELNGDYSHILNAAQQHYNEVIREGLHTNSPEELIELLGEENLAKISSWLHPSLHSTFSKTSTTLDNPYSIPHEPINFSPPNQDDLLI